MSSRTTLQIIVSSKCIETWKSYKCFDVQTYFISKLPLSLFPFGVDQSCYHWMADQPIREKTNEECVRSENENERFSGFPD